MSLHNLLSLRPGLRSTPSIFILAIELWCFKCFLFYFIRLDKEINLRTRVEAELKRVERRLHEKESLIAVISKERKQLDDQVKDLEAELKKLEDELEKQKKLLEDEIIRRVEAENRAQTLEEEAAFKAQIHAKVCLK